MGILLGGEQSDGHLFRKSQDWISTRVDVCIDRGFNGETAGAPGLNPTKPKSANREGKLYWISGF
jgi:hypothetical protein